MGNIELSTKGETSGRIENESICRRQIKCRLTLSLLLTTQETFVDSVNQD